MGPSVPLQIVHIDLTVIQISTQRLKLRSERPETILCSADQRTAS